MKACDSNFIILLKILTIFEKLVIHAMIHVMILMSVVFGKGDLRKGMG